MDLLGYPLDIVNYMKENGGEKKILADVLLENHLRDLKICMFI